jgi:hypothetical protein
MAIIYIDYSFSSPEHMASTAVPSLTRGKFVQIRHESTEYLIFASADSAKYHAQIIERFCHDRVIKGAYDAGGERFQIEDKAWNVVGGGKFQVDREKKILRLYDDSMAYGKFDRRRLKEKIYEISGFAGFTVLVE